MLASDVLASDEPSGDEMDNLLSELADIPLTTEPGFGEAEIAGLLLV